MCLFVESRSPQSTEPAEPFFFRFGKWNIFRNLELIKPHPPDEPKSLSFIPLKSAGSKQPGLKGEQLEIAQCILYETALAHPRLANQRRPHHLAPGERLRNSRLQSGRFRFT